MANFTVNILAVVRVKVENVTADSPEQAAKVAEESADLDKLFENVRFCSSDAGPRIAAVEYAGDVVDFLVDEVDDEEVVGEHTLDSHYHPVVSFDVQVKS